MTMTERSLLGSVDERDVQLGLVQLLHTSIDFRKWLMDKIDLPTDQTKFEGVSHSVWGDYGETDIEVRLDINGAQHVGLIEVKTGSSTHSDQINRYFQRGKMYVEEEMCENFSVVVIAPENNVPPNLSEAELVTLESILKGLEDIQHDGVPYLHTLFRNAITQERNNDKSIVLTRIENTLRERATDIEFIQEPTEFDDKFAIDEPRNRLKIWSKHSDHPEKVRYGIRIKYEDRVMLGGIGAFDVSDRIQRRVHDVLSDCYPLLDLPTYRTDLADNPTKSQGKVKTIIQIPSEANQVSDAPVEQAAEDLVELINTFHHPLREEFG